MTAEPDKNLHASIPDALLAEAQKVADAQHTTVDELVRDAMERCLRDIRRQKLRAYGEEQARKMGVSSEEDVERVIHEYREEQRERNNSERGR